MRLANRSALTPALSPRRGSAKDPLVKLYQLVTAFIRLRRHWPAARMNQIAEDLFDADDHFSLSWGRGPG